MKRPAFQFYTGDWRKNAKLRRCSDGARGAWIDVLCVMHDSEEYGVLRWPLAEIARVAGVKIKLLKELSDKGVMKGSDMDAPGYAHRPRHGGVEGAPVTLIVACSGPCWYSSRMVRDEWARKARGASTRFQPSLDPSPDSSPTHRQGDRQGGPPSGTPTQRQGDGASSSSSTSRSSVLTVTTEASASAYPDSGRSTSTPPSNSKAVSKTLALLEKQRVDAEHASPPPEGFLDEWKRPVDHFEPIKAKA